jgi:hypothetical protein
MIGKALDEWARRNGVRLDFIAPAPFDSLGVRAGSLRLHRNLRWEVPR